MEACWKGVFSPRDENDVAGELKIDNSDGTAKVSLWGIGEMRGLDEVLTSNTLHGLIWQGKSAKCLSAFGCHVSKHRYAIVGSMYRTDVVFQFAAIGRKCVEVGDVLATAARFQFDGFEQSLPALGGFETVMQPDAKLKAEIERSVSTERKRSFKLGERPVVGIYDGSTSDLTVGGTVLGDIEINSRNVTIPFGEPLKKEGPFIRLSFDKPISLICAYRRLSSVRHFVGLIIGYVPRLTALDIESMVDTEHLESFEFLVPGDRLNRGRTRQASVGISLLNHVKRQEEFRTVMTKWLRRNQEEHRRDSNARFLGNFGSTSYNEDRLIGAVNVFDLLPPSDTCYSNGKGRSVSSIIKNKAKSIQAVIGDDTLPNLNWVIDCAVNGRNHYVHGKPAKVNLRAGSVMIFLTSTMEFIYGVSELLACGWDLGAWLREDRGGAHPFGSFLRQYGESLALLVRNKR